MILFSGWGYLRQSLKSGIYRTPLDIDCLKFLGTNMFGTSCVLIDMLIMNGCSILACLPTLHCLASFGLEVDRHFYLCVGGLETDSHLFLSCTFSQHILGTLASKLGLHQDSDTWTHLLRQWGSITYVYHRSLSLLVAQVFCYHILRERNNRSHNKGCLGPNKLLDCILVNI